MNLISDMAISILTPEYIDYSLEKLKSEAKRKASKRQNFNKPLDELKAVFNWYRENDNYKFFNPVLKRHYRKGIISKPRPKEKILKQDQLISFFQAFNKPLFQDFAIVQFFSAGRFGEIAGIQIKNLDFNHESLLIKEVVVEDQSKKFLELKPYPKNGSTRAVSISSEFFKNALLRRMENIDSSSSYLFHINGLPLGYRQVQFQYNKALKKIGLFPEFSSTHFLRYTMASESRRVMGSLDAAKAMTGHHSIKMAEHYAKLPNNLQTETVQKVSLDIENRLQKLNSLPVLG